MPIAHGLEHARKTIIDPYTTPVNPKILNPKT